MFGDKSLNLVFEVLGIAVVAGLGFAIAFAILTTAIEVVRSIASYFIVYVHDGQIVYAISKWGERKQLPLRPGRYIGFWRFKYFLLKPVQIKESFTENVLAKTADSDCLIELVGSLYLTGDFSATFKVPILVEWERRKTELAKRMVEIVKAEIEKNTVKELLSVSLRQSVSDEMLTKYAEEVGLENIKVNFSSFSAMNTAHKDSDEEEN